MIKKMFEKPVVFVLFITLMFFSVRGEIYAEMIRDEADGLLEVDKKEIITGFEEFDIRQHALHFDSEFRPSLDEVQELMPDTLGVFLEGEDEITQVKVDWFCITDDFEKAEYYYYQFSPKWDETFYSLSEDIDLLTEAPYIGVHFAHNNIALLSVTNNSNETVIYNFLRNELNLNVAAACGVLANIYHESSFNPTAYNGNDTGGTVSYGICQWNNGAAAGNRYGLLQNWCSSNGYDYKTLDGQLNYMKHELQTTPYYKLSALQSIANSADGAYEASILWSTYYEGCAKVYYETRANLAKNTYWPEYSGNSPDTSVISISNGNAPDSIKEGNVFSITGTVSSGNKLTNVTAGVYDCDGNMSTGKSANPNATSYNLKNLDPYVYFNHLSHGVYTYRVTASNASGTTTLVEKVFAVLTNNSTISEGIYQIQPKSSNAYVVDIAGHTDSNGVNIQLGENSNSPYQKFIVKYAGEGYYTLENAGSGKYVDVNGAYSTQGTNVQQYENNGSTAQLWQILPVGNYYCMVPKCATSLCFDIANNSMAEGANIQVYTANLTDAQKFKFISTSLETPHTHSYTSEITQKPTCTAEGIRTYSCDCGDSYTKTISATGHSYGEWNTVQKATYETTGLKERICTNCKNKEQQIIEKLEKRLPYIDVRDSDWFYDAVFYSYIEGIMTGMEPTIFGPYETLSRAQFAVIMYRMSGSPNVGSSVIFKDIAGDEWYAKAVIWAYNSGIVSGYEDGRFGPADMITREQMAVMMYRYARYQGLNVNVNVELETFSDQNQVSVFAKDAMRWAVGKRIITGKDNGMRLAPQENTARAECAVIIDRFIRNR